MGVGACCGGLEGGRGMWLGGEWGVVVRVGLQWEEELGTGYGLREDFVGRS